MKLQAYQRRVLARAALKGVAREVKRTARQSLSDKLVDRGLMFKGARYGLWQEYHLTDAGREALAGAN